MSEVTGMMSALLVGGAHDGTRLKIGMYETIIRMQRIKEKVTADSFVAVIDEYYKTSFHLQDKGKIGDFSLFTHSSIPNNSIVAVQMLIEGYRRPQCHHEPGFPYSLESLGDYPVKPKRGGGF